MRCIRLIGGLGVALAITTACHDSSELFTPFAKQPSTVAPLCYGRTATIYEGHPGSGTITINAAGGMNITGTSVNDVIVGSAFTDSIEGHGGTDRICAGDGDDVLSGGPGRDFLDGEAGVDEASYTTSTAGVTVDLNRGGGLGGDADRDRLANMENVTGSAHDDDLRGNAGANRLDGGDGDDRLAGGDDVDVLLGGAGNDLLSGDAGGDMLDGGTGNDELLPGAGVDQVLGGADIDRVNYRTSPVGVIVDLATGLGANGDAEGDTYDGVESILGSAHADKLYGDGDVNVIHGHTGVDTISGGGADDTLRGNLGNDVLYGGDGADFLLGDQGEDELYGDAGNDRLFGGPDNDELYGGDDDDDLRPGSGVNTVDGGPGFDHLDSGYCLDTVTNVESFVPSNCVAAASAAHSQIDAANSTIDADGVSATTITVQLKNTSGSNLTLGGSTVSLTTTAGLLSDGVTQATTLTAIDQDNGTYTLTLISSTDLETAVITGEVNSDPMADDAQVDFVVGALDHFVVTGEDGNPITQQAAGVAFNIKIVAQDAANHTVTAFTGTVDLISTPGGSLGSSGSFTGGERTQSVTIASGGDYTITATLPGDTEAGTSGSFTVTALPNAVANEVAGGSAPLDAYHGVLNTALSIADGALDLLANDGLGFPSATVTHFGALQTNDGAGAFESPSGTVTTNLAGATVAVGNGSLTVNADGTVNFTPPTNYTGLFRFQYRIGNSGGTSDAQVTLAVGVRPAAVNDTYSGGTLIANVTLDTNTGTIYSVSTNDAGDQRTVAINTPIASSGAYTLNSNGTFLYEPAAGFSGAAGFTYDVTNGFGTVTGTAGLTVGTSRIWFVDQAAGVSGSGTQASPFKNPGNITNSGALPNPQDNDVIFLYQNATAYTGTLTLRAGQKLIGQDATATLQSLSGATPATHQTLPAMDTNAPAVTLTSTGTTITLGSGNTLRGFVLGDATTSALTGNGFGTLTLAGDVAINNTLGQALSLTNGTVSGNINGVSSAGGAANIALVNVAGTVDFGSGALSGATGNAMLVQSGAGSFTYGGSISAAGTARPATLENRSGGGVTLTGNITATGLGLLIQNNTGGTYTFSGATKSLSTGTNDAVTLTSNTGATINFSNGGLGITTTSGRGFRASGGGTVSVGTGANNNTVTIATGESALWLTGMTVGADDITFATLSGTGTTAGSPLCIQSTTGSLTQTINVGTLAIAGTSGGPGVCVESSSAPVTITNATIDNTAAAGIQITSSTAAVSVNGGSIGATNDPTGNVVDVDGGNATVTIIPPLTKSTAGRIVEVTGRSAGTVSITGALNCTSSCTGINLASNTGGTIEFTNATKTLSTGASNAITLATNTNTAMNFTNGGLAISTTSGHGLIATGGGTLTVSGTPNTITTGAGTALSLTNTTSNGLLFRSITAGSGGAVGSLGIVMDNTGTGGLTVTGNSAGNCGGLANPSPLAAAPYGTATAPNEADCTGGIIEARNGADGALAGMGIFLRNTSNISLTRMRIRGTHQNYALRGYTLSNLTLNNIYMDGTFGTSSTVFGDFITPTPNTPEYAVRLENLTGTASVTNSTFRGGHSHEFVLFNGSGGSLNRITFDQVTFPLQTVATAGAGILIHSVAGNAGGVLNVTVQNSRFLGQRGSGISLATQSNTTSDFIIQNNVLFNSHGTQISGNAGISMAVGSSTTDNSTVTYNVTGNRVRGQKGTALAMQMGTGTGSATGNWTNNRVGEASVANSGSLEGMGMYLNVANAAKHKVLVEDNVFSQTNGSRIIWVLAGGSTLNPRTGSIHATIRRNTLNAPGSNNIVFVSGLGFDLGTNSTDAYTMCLSVGQGGGNSNNIVNGWRTGPGPEFIKGEPIDFMANTLSPGALWYKVAGYSGTHTGTAAQTPLIQTIQATNGGVAATGYAETPSASATSSTNNAVGVVCDLF